MTVDDNLVTANAPENGRWEFDSNVAEAFDAMLEKSIPQYEVMRKAVADATCWFADRRSIAGGKAHVVDLGASRGSALAPILDRVGARARYTAVEVAEPMVEVLRERFEGWIEAGVFDVKHADLREGIPLDITAADVVLSVLTLQFIPIEYRQTLLRDAYERLRPGGALILVEKVLGEADETNRLLVDLYYGMKRENGYTQEAIDRKRYSLEGVLVPLTAEFNVQLLRRSGFDLVEQLWAYYNFRGWVAIKR